MEPHAGPLSLRSYVRAFLFTKHDATVGALFADYFYRQGVALMPVESTVLARIELIVKKVCADCPADSALDPDAPLPSLGIDSITLVFLLDAVAAEFHITWDSGTPAGTVSSLHALADFVTEELTRGRC